MIIRKMEKKTKLFVKIRYFFRSCKLGKLKRKRINFIKTNNQFQINAYSFK